MRRWCGWNGVGHVKLKKKALKKTYVKLLNIVIISIYIYINKMKSFQIWGRGKIFAQLQHRDYNIHKSVFPGKIIKMCLRYMSRLLNSIG